MENEKQVKQAEQTSESVIEHKRFFELSDKEKKALDQLRVLVELKTGKTGDYGKILIGVDETPKAKIQVAPYFGKNKRPDTVSMVTAIMLEQGIPLDKIVPDSPSVKRCPARFYSSQKVNDDGSTWESLRVEVLVGERTLTGYLNSDQRKIYKVMKLKHEMLPDPNGIHVSDDDIADVTWL